MCSVKWIDLEIRWNISITLLVAKDHTLQKAFTIINFVCSYAGARCSRAYIRCILSGKCILSLDVLANVMNSDSLVRLICV